MATKRRKKVPAYKPEAVLRARPKAAPQPVAVKKPTKKAKKRRSVSFFTRIRRFGRHRLPRSVFLSILGIILGTVVVAVGVYVQHSVHETNVNLAEASKTADQSFLVAKKEADLIRIIGTKAKRQSEIVNYQSAPSSLQAFMTADYRAFKQQCVANGMLADDVGYELNNVIYDSYAVVKRTCNGTDTAILKRFGNAWTVAFSGNVLPPCSLVNDLTIPQGASYYCAQGGVRYLNPNP